MEKLKIIFICGSLENGKDGVGDYTRLLALELIKNGHEVYVIALNDKYVNELQYVNENNSNFFYFCRIPSFYSFSSKSKIINKIVSQFDPVWLSLQYVPFSFQDKGLTLRLSKMLVNIGHGRKWHIMFHEIWVGLKVNESIKKYIWGNLQRLIIINLVRRLNPILIHTQSPLYQKLLIKNNIKANILPLFSNIPNANTVDKDVNATDIVLIHFGSLHYVSNLNAFVNAVKNFQIKNKLNIVIKIIGRAGRNIEIWEKVCLASNINLEVLGEKEPEIIEKEIKQADIGISTTDLVLIHKSGAVAAMRECGIPVICLDNQWMPRGINVPSIPSGIYLFNNNVIEDCLNFRNETKDFPGLIEITKKFIADLTKTLN